ncbi:hypothetical protein ACRB68_80050 [Actinomadura sp. RB68]|uniref:Uncharacterized protein n=1 Tax=Actinomadura macrotermitis TaxID=2585200 RepID=A0A7K0C8U5_9ACTN|nr:hypothetical protein [Actinomadura macrotermitis]
MDIVSVAMTATGAFGAGLTVGALMFSPRLITRTEAPPVPAGPPPVVYLVDPGTYGLPAGAMVAPPGVQAPAAAALPAPAPAGPAEIDRSGQTEGNRFQGPEGQNHRDHDPVSGVSLITPQGSPAARRPSTLPEVPR